MLFNSLRFLIFFPAVCLVHVLLPSRYRTAFLLASSYFFYMNWQPIYALLILTSTMSTYACARLMTWRARKLILIVSIAINLSLLFVFKYVTFVNESLFQLMENFGIRWEMPQMRVLLPVGISFYTFQAIGYTIDVYRGRVSAERDVVTYAAFVSFFPQLVAGPIERAAHLLPQFKQDQRASGEDVATGLKQMLWGYFMKLVVAERASLYVDAVYGNVAQHNGTSFIIASVLFAFQIYCDFAGYSNIAIGAARVLGFRLTVNFQRPYFAASFSQFWRRWHISLSEWFRDYVYIPLGGSRVSGGRHVVNLALTFLLSGLWHGANWTFLFWGGLHATYVIAEVLIRKVLRVRWHALVTQPMVFALTVLAWIAFRSNSITEAFTIMRKVFTRHGSPFLDKGTLVYAGVAMGVLLVKDIMEECWPDAQLFHKSGNPYVRSLSYAGVAIMILLFGVFDGSQFIYFQF